MSLGQRKAAVLCVAIGKSGSRQGPAALVDRGRVFMLSEISRHTPLSR